jgi:DNA-binding HxlR family transcriptional regulator
VAKALDVVGDRWNLLIVRELLLRERCRYTDLRNGLPGLATNLLAERVRDLEAAGIIFREDARPPVATTVFGLTERGRALEPVLRELALWGAPLMTDMAAGEFRDHWLGLIAETYLADHEPQRRAISVQLNAGAEAAILRTSEGLVHVHPGTVEKPDLTLTGQATVLAGVLTGQLTLSQARSQGLKCAGETGALRRIRGSQGARHKPVAYSSGPPTNDRKGSSSSGRRSGREPRQRTGGS